MWAVTLKGLLAHKTRLALTGLAIVLGVAFVAGTLIFTDSLDDSFAGLFADINANTDAYVNPVKPFEDTSPETAFVPELPTLDASVLDLVAGVEGVADAGGFVQGFAQIIAPDGTAVGGQGPPTLGFNYDDFEGGAVTLREGRGPQSRNEVTIDIGSAEAAGLGIGDDVDVVTPIGRRSYQVVGTTGFGDEDDLLGATIVTFDLAEAREVFDKDDVYDQLAVIGEPDIDSEELMARIAAVLPEDAEVVSAASQSESDLEDIRSFLGFFNTILLTFAAVSLFVGAFIIANTFSIVVAQRTREFALLRAVGASTRQVTRSVMLEALLVGVVASALGLLVGIGLAGGLRGLLDAFGFGFPEGENVLAPRTVVVSLVLGTVLTLVSAALPALRAARVPPVEAMRPGSQASEGSSSARTVLGAVAGAVGVVALIVGLLATPDNAISYVGAGALLTMLGVALLSPLIAGRVTGVLGLPVARRSVDGRLARENSRRNPKRTASTASALMIGLALVSFVTILASSITGSVARLLDEQFRSDFIIAGAAAGPPQLFSPAISAAVDALPETGAVSGIRLGTTQPQDAAGSQIPIAAVDAAVIDELVSLGAEGGDVSALGEGQFLALGSLAEERGWAVGDTIPFTFIATGTRELEMVGTFESDELIGGRMLVDLSTYEANFNNDLEVFIYGNAADGVAVEDALAAVEGVLADAPNLGVRDQASFREEQDAAIGQILNLMIALLFFAIVVALIGITNTMALSVFERTRELGLLRAVGMTRRQVRRMVRYEAGIVSAFGAVLGVVVGAFFAWSVVRSLAEQGLDTLVFPVGRLLVYIVIAALAGIAAGSFPARRAANLDVLEAVTTE